MADHQSRSLEQQSQLDLSDKNLGTARQNHDCDEKNGDQNYSSVVGCNRHKSDAGAAHVINDDNKKSDKLVIDIDTDDESDMSNDIPLLVADPLPADVKFPTKTSKVTEYQKSSQKLNPEAPEFIPADPGMTFAHTSYGIFPREILRELDKPSELRSRLFHTKMQPYFEHWSRMTDVERLKLYIELEYRALS